MHFTSVLLGALALSASAQPSAVNFTSMTTDANGQATISFISSTTDTDVAQSFDVTLEGVNPFPLPDPMLWGTRTGSFGTTPETDPVGSQLDTTRYRATVNVPFVPGPCPLSAAGLLCKTQNASIVTSGRRTTLLSNVGHMMQLLPFMRWSGGIANAPNMANGMAILEPLFTLGQFPMNRGYSIEAIITQFPIAFNWFRFSWSGLLIYDLDAQGRIRPLMRTVLDEWNGQWVNNIPTCSGGLPGQMVTSCFWSQTAGFGIGGGNVDPQPSVTQPWRYILDIDPVARTFSTRHSNGRFPNGWTATSAFSSWPTSMNRYWTEYVNRTDCATTFGCLFWENIRVAPYVETQSISGTLPSTFGMQVDRVIAYLNPQLITTVSNYPGAGPTRGFNSILNLAGTAVDPARYELSGGSLPYSNAGGTMALTTSSPAGECELPATANLQCKVGNTVTYPWGLPGGDTPVFRPSFVAPVPLTRSMRMQITQGHNFAFQDFMNFVNTPAATRETNMQATPLQNAVPFVELNYDPRQFAFAYKVESSIVGFPIFFDWNRDSFHGVYLYHKVKSGPFAGMIRPLFRSGLYDYWGSYYNFVPFCSTFGSQYFCSWRQVFGTHNVGSSVVTAPTETVPWFYSIARDPFSRSWQVEHRNPRPGIPEYNAGTGAPLVTDAQLQGLMGNYWSDYLNNPIFGQFDWDDVKVGVGIEGGNFAFTWPLDFGIDVKSMYIENYRDVVLMQQSLAWTAAVAAAAASGSRCAYAAPSTTTVQRTGTCVLTTCSVVVPIPTANLNYSVTITPIGLARGVPRRATDHVQFRPSLPIPGAQLWVDPASMPTFLGAFSGNQVCPFPTTGSNCRLTSWMHSADPNAYRFGGAQSTVRPMYKPWTLSDPFPALVFDGFDDSIGLDAFERMSGRDAEFDLQFPDQTNYTAGRDAETTWFLLYRPADPTSNQLSVPQSRTVFSKGDPSLPSGSYYTFYQQRTVASPAGQFAFFDQMLGMAVAADAGTGAVNTARGTVVGRRYARINFQGIAGSHPHVAGGALLTISHYRNNTGVSPTSTRAYRLDACEGVITGNWATDACSRSGGTSPADRWSSTPDPALGAALPPSTMGVQTLLRQDTLTSAVPGGAQHVDYNLGPFFVNRALRPSPANMPSATGALTIGAASNGGGTVPGSFYRGQILSLVMYRRAMTDAEKMTTQMFLLDRYNQLCPAIPVQPGAVSGCPASGGGATCLVLCNGATTPPNVRIGGQSDLLCANGAWRGRMPVCGAQCPARSSPRDYATCALKSTDMNFFSGSEYPTDTTTGFSRLRWLDAFAVATQGSPPVPVPLPHTMLNRHWVINNAGTSGRKALIGTPSVATGCSPQASGPLQLIENNPAYRDTQLANARQQVDAVIRLLTAGTSAGVLFRARSTGETYRVLIGSVIAIERFGAVPAAGNPFPTTISSISPLASPIAWDFTGNSAYALRVVASRVNPALLTDTRVQITVQVSQGFEFTPLSAVTLFNMSDPFFNPNLVGAGGLVVNTGSAGFERFTVHNDCELNGNVCRTGQEQACLFTCQPGTIPTVGSVPYNPVVHGVNYYETCSSAGTVVGPSGPFSCQPAPPTYPSNPVRLNITEGSPIATPAGFVGGRVGNPRHVVIYTLFPQGNDESLYDRLLNPIGRVPDVFAIGACSGEILLNRANVISYDNSLRMIGSPAVPATKRFFNLLVQGCTQGNALACANVTVQIEILNAPTRPRFELTDPDSQLSDGIYRRTVPECTCSSSCPTGRIVNRFNRQPNGLPIMAISDEGNAITYSMAPGGSAGGLFQVNSTSGHLQIARPGAFNFEVQNEYLVIVRATDAVNGLTEDQEVAVTVLDMPDCPTFPPSQAPPALFTQIIDTGTETAVTTPGAVLGDLSVVDEDGQTMTGTVVSANPPPWIAIQAGTSGNVKIVVNSTLARAGYGSILTSPVLIWRTRQVREVIRFTVVIRDPTGLTGTANVEMGIISNATGSGPEPQMTAVSIPNAMGAGTPGLLTRGNEVITINGRNFNRIVTDFANVLTVSLNSQENDQFPNRSYPCNNPRVVNDNTITCFSPHAWGSNLFLRVTYDPSRRVMASESGALTVSYAPPVLLSGQFSLGGLFSFPTDTALCDRERVPTVGGCMLLLTAHNLGRQADASSILRLEFGQPVPGTDRLEYVAPYVPCGGTRTYENWATPTSGMLAQTRVCILMPPGIGWRNTFQVRVGTVVSNVSAPNPWELPPATMSFFGWFISYLPPAIDRVYKPINVAGLAPPNWDRTANGGDFRPGEIVWFNGTNFGPINKVPLVTFWLPGNTRVMFNNGQQLFGTFNFTPPVNTATGMPNCWKPRLAEAHSLMACEVPYGASFGLRIRLQLGTQAAAPTTWPPSINIIVPSVTAIAGPGARGANTEGGQQVIVRGLYLGPFADRFAELTSNTYAPKPYPANPATLNFLPITLWYGPTRDEFRATNCRVTSEQPSEISCLTGPGVGRNFLFVIGTGGQNATLRVTDAGYAPPLISDVVRVPGEPVDPELGRVPTSPREYRTPGGDVFRINGRNFGPCPPSGCQFIERAPGTRFIVEYFVQLDDARTDYNTTIGDASRRIFMRAHSCNMTVAHQQVECRTAAGAGTDAVVRMTVAGQQSILPFTAYGRPSVTSLSILSPAGIPKAAASTDGGDTLVIRGSNFGPRQDRGVACGPTARCRGMIQSITYGVGGEEYRVTDWDLPASADATHDEIRVVLGPGVGTNLRVVVTVADQESLAVTGGPLFAYASPVITSWGPTTGPAVPERTSPVSITLSGQNFGLANRFAEVLVAFGNPEDGSLIQGIPLTSRFPDLTVTGQVDAYMATPEPRTERITFNLPEGAAKQRAVRIFVLDTTSASAVPVFSAPVFFDYIDPNIDAVVVEALKQFNNGTEASGVTTEFGAASSIFPESLSQVRKLTLRGANFGTRDVGTVAWQVEMAPFDRPTEGNITWTPAPSATHAIIDWTDTRIVVLTTASRALLRVRRTGLMFNPPVNPESGLRDPVPLDSISPIYEFADFSPEITNLVGASGPFKTTGGEIISFMVTGLASLSTELRVTVSSNGVARACPIVYAPDDSRAPGQAVANINDLRTNIIFWNGARRYWSNRDGSTASFAVNSDWTLFCRLPPGQGSAASLVISRDGVPSSAFPITYQRPSITQIQLMNGGAVEQTITFTPGVVVSVPTPGMQVRVSGTNFGTCPGVVAGQNRVFMQLPNCNFTDSLQQAGTGAVGLMDAAATSAELTFTMPAGEGTGFSFAVEAGDQSSLTDQFIAFTYRPPTITTVTREARTVGGDVFTLVGTNLGITAPSITLGSYTCMNVIRPAGLPGHTSVTCTVPEGSGVALDVAVTVAAQRAVLPAGFSYSRPEVHRIDVTDSSGVVTTYNGTALSSGFIGGPSAGAFKMTLYGDNFGVPDYSRHCLFVSWRARAGRTRQPPNTPFNCADRRETFIGEGQLPEIALTAFGAVVSGSGNATVQSMAWSHSEITFLFPPGTGFKDIVVFVAGNTPVRPPVWRYNAPVITNELEPSTGPTDGGSALRVLGANFGMPALRTDTPAGVASAQNLPVPESMEAYLNRQYAPQAAMSITFGRGCVSEHFTAEGVTPDYLSRCERGRIRTHMESSIRFTSPAGVGLNRSVFVSIWDLVPVPGNEDEVIATEIRSNIVIFNYEPPEVELTEPRPLLLDDEGGVVFIRGRNFGTLKLARLQQWTPEEEFVNVTINNRVAAIRVDRVVEAGTNGQDIDKVRVLLPNLPVGYHNMTYTVAGQTGVTTTVPLTRASLLVGCQSGLREDFRTEDMGPWGGYFGRPGETCAPCPVGAICLGFDSRFGPRAAIDRGLHMYPIPVTGFYNLNSSDSLTTGMYDACPEEVRARYPNRDSCVVRCDPPEACLGANQCAPEYISKAPMYRCASCAPGFYKRATVCVKCPDSPWALVIGFVLLVMVGGGIAYALNRVRINIAYIAIAIDYFQVLAIFAQSRVQWPAALQELFHVLSAFNLNIEIVAPECIVPDLGFQRKWSFVMAFPLALQVFFALVTVLNLTYKALVKGQKVKLAYVGGAVMASVLMVMYIMYIYLTRNILDIYNCKPTDPPDGKTYMVAVFEECGKPGGVQLTLLPAAVVATFVYIIGYPAGIAYLLFKERELVMEDQLLRAKGMGDDRASNPHAYQFRKRWGRLYYQFKPDTVMWILVIILRKFLIAATFVLFNTQPAFQLAAVFLVLFLAYSAQMRFDPYMSPQDFDNVLEDHRKKAFTDITHQRLKASLDGISTRTKRTTRKNLLDAQGKVDAKALLGVLRGWLFNYNTVEQLMLFSAGIVCVMGMMFAAQQRRSSTYRESRDAITSVVIAVVALSIIYLFTVFVVEVTVLAGEANRKKLALAGAKGAKKSGSDEEAAGKSSKKSAAEGTENFDAGNVETATNPMFMSGGGAGQKKAARPASESSDGAADSAMMANLEALEAADVISSLRDPPGNKEMWHMYKEKYLELAGTVATLKAQLDAAPPALRAGGAAGPASKPPPSP